VSEATKGVESIVAVTFEQCEDHTEIILRHSGVPDDEMGRQHSEGRTLVLSMLAERFGAGVWLQDLTRCCCEMSASASRRDNTDRSLARSAWESVPRKNRPVGYGMNGRS
jgi:hypothetical protein